MCKFGLKLWSTNKNYINEARKLYKEDLFNYIELFVVPNSYKKFISLWKNLKIPFVIHGPHSLVGLNLAKEDFLKNNFNLIKETLKFSDELNAKFIIFHPGIDGDLNQTVKQLNKLNDTRILIENMPYFAIDGKTICNGYSPEDIEFIIKNTGVGFCFDIAHSIYSANAQKINKLDYIDSFNEPKPKMYHLADGDWNGVIDKHKNLGKGSFDFDNILNKIIKNSLVTLETKKNYQDNLKDFERDVLFIKKLSEKLK